MKITKLLSLIIVSAFLFTACSSEETMLPQTEKTSLLKSYKIQRDASGAYSIDFDVQDNVKTEKVKNHASNTNEFHLYESDFSTIKRQSEELLIDGNQLSIGFIDTNTDKRPNITILDDNISSIKTSAKSKDMLKAFSITANEDGTFNLDFNVADQVSVDFIKNEENGTYEIHLEEGKSTDSEFSRVLEKEEGKVLKIDFINYITSNIAAKGTSAKEVIRRKPRVIIDNGEDMGIL